MQRLALKCGRFYRLIPRCVNNNKLVPRLQYLTTNLPNQLSNTRRDKVIERTFHKRNANYLDEAMDANEVQSIKFLTEDNIIQINFISGQTLTFNTIWLRDSCNCDQCVHPFTKNKLINSADICVDLFADSFDCFDNIIEICWRNGSNKEHVSQYSINWLKLFGDVFGNYPPNEIDSNLGIKTPNDIFYSSEAPDLEPILWDSTQIDRHKLTTNYSDFMNSSESVKNVLELFSRFGIAFLEGVPIEKSAVLSVTRRMAHERQTSYGSSLNVMSKPDANTHIGYSSAQLAVDVDLAHRERSPGVQLLHCLKEASVGGAATLVDGFKCAEALLSSDPDLFDVLAQNPILFSFCDKEKGIWFREKWPIIRLDGNRRLKEMHLSETSMRPPLLPLQVLDPFYEAFRILTELIRDDRFGYRFLLRPGDLLMINNRRVLHGRDQLDHSRQTRHLEECYMDLDEVMALYEKLNH